ncbi:MAG: pilus assembly protein PilM [Candidatus Omnitrophota bacterium]|nr:pilus assembly protein PilM [Candidatus Omnitrophota bacterium]MBU1929501.1 pilus assembly protein PilM [Candidatus Omnitrophota bacterium]MBU2035152.1 pilus assembly protein PilM [Candidatus Omnitrophota bacterium]MBU2222062.1 pilus assembly protein PilM [Candidatus Omnitrophota bacterium]
MDNPFKTKKIKNSQPLSIKRVKLSLNNSFSLLKNIVVSTQNIMGIDIGSNYIKIAQLQKSGKSYIITNYVARAIPLEARDNISEKKRLVREFVKEFLSSSRVKTTLLRSTIFGKGIFIFSLSVPYMNKKDLKGAVNIELKKRLPFQLDINNVSFDYFITDQIHDDKGLSYQITCIAAEKSAIDEQLYFLKEMNIRPVGINVIPDILGNILPLCLNYPADKPVPVLELGANVSSLNFYKGKNLIFSREIPIAGEHLTRAMAKTINTANGPINISIEDAEKIKRTCGVPLDDEAKNEFLTDFGVILGEQISTMLRPTLERLILEINRTISYYVKTFRGVAIDELYITGGSSRLNNMDKFLLYNLEGVKKVEHLNVLKAVKGWADPGVLRQELVIEQAAPHLSVVFGLCFGKGGRINLLPAKEKLEQKTIFLANIIRISFPIVLILSLVFYAIIYGNSLKYKVLNSKLDLGISSLEPIAHQVREYMSIKSRLEQRKDILEKARGKQPLWWGILKELSNITPKEVILKQVILGQGNNDKEIRLIGKIFAKYTIVDVAVSQYLMALEESPFFINVELASSKTDMYSAIPAADFEIVCRLVY